jgi:hypothetical protein
VTRYFEQKLARRERMQRARRVRLYLRVKP